MAHLHADLTDPEDDTQIHLDSAFSADWDVRPHSVP